jgi:hypothetical protein
MSALGIWLSQGSSLAFRKQETEFAKVPTDEGSPVDNLEREY